MPGNIVSAPSMMAPGMGLIAPDIAVQQQQLAREQALADALRRQSLEPADAGGGRVSWTQGLAKLAQAYTARTNQKDIDAKQIDVARQQAAALRGMFGAGGGPAAGNPAAAPAASADPSTAVVAPGGQPGFGQDMANALKEYGGVAPPPASPQPQTAAGTPPGAAPSPGGGSGSVGPWSLSGNPDQDMASYMMNPEEYGKAVIGAQAPTDYVKSLRQAGIDPNSPLGRQLQQANIAKQNYVAPINGRPGSTLRDPYDPSKVVGFDAPNIEGSVPTYGADGMPSGYKQLPGATQAIAAAAGAKTAGSNANEPIAGFDAAGNPTYSNKLDAAHGGAGSPGGFKPGQTPGQEQFLSQLGTDSAKFFTDLQTRAQTANQQIYALKQVVDLANGPTQFGPGSEASVKAAGLLNGVGQAFGYQPSFNDKNVTNQQVMGKFAAQVASSAASSMGLNGSDARFNVAQQANPSGHMTNNALKDVVPYVMGLAQASSDAGRVGAAFARANPGPNAQGDFQTMWNKAYEPRLYTWRAQGPQAMAAGVKALPPAEAAHVLQQYRQLKQMGAFQ
jgi:hypothetical protein